MARVIQECLGVLGEVDRPAHSDGIAARAVPIAEQRPDYRGKIPPSFIPSKGIAEMNSQETALAPSTKMMPTTTMIGATTLWRTG